MQDHDEDMVHIKDDNHAIDNLGDTLLEELLDSGFEDIVG